MPNQNLWHLNWYRIYLFSVKNPLEVENGHKPDLEEVGPFTYVEEVERVNEKFEGGHVTFETKKTWSYIQNESLSLDTVITTIDVPILAASESVRGNFWKVTALLLPIYFWGLSLLFVGVWLCSNTSQDEELTIYESFSQGYTIWWIFWCLAHSRILLC